MKRFKPLIAAFIPPDAAWFPLAVVAGAAAVFLFAVKHNAPYPLTLRISWAVGIYFIIPLALAALLDADRPPARITAAVALAAILAPVVFRSYTELGGRLLAENRAPLIISGALSLVLSLSAFRLSGATLAGWGLGKGDWRWWLPRAAAILGGIVLLVMAASALSPELRTYYPAYPPAQRNLSVFILYQCLMLLYMAGWEFFFRGYLLFGLARVWGPWPAILCQTLPFFLLHSRKPELEMASSFLGGIALGGFAWRAGSAWPAVIIHWVMHTTMEIVGFIFRRP